MTMMAYTHTTHVYTVSGLVLRPSHHTVSGLVPRPSHHTSYTGQNRTHTHSPAATCNKTANLRWGQTISYAKCESSLPACSTIPFCVSAKEQVDTQWLLTVWWTRTQLLVPMSELLFHLTMVNLSLSYCCKHVWLAKLPHLHWTTGAIIHATLVSDNPL